MNYFLLKKNTRKLDRECANLTGKNGHQEISFDRSTTASDCCDANQGRFDDWAPTIDESTLTLS
jgi:hypothetical protein